MIVSERRLLLAMNLLDPTRLLRANTETHPRLQESRGCTSKDDDKKFHQECVIWKMKKSMHTLFTLGYVSVKYRR